MTAPMMAPAGVELFPAELLPDGKLAAIMEVAVTATTSIEVICVVIVEPPTTAVSVDCSRMVVDDGNVDEPAGTWKLDEVAESPEAEDAVDPEEGSDDATEVCVDWDALPLEQVVP